jgi:hypothetical protein
MHTSRVLRKQRSKLPIQRRRICPPNTGDQLMVTSAYEELREQERSGNKQSDGHWIWKVCYALSFPGILAQLLDPPTSLCVQIVPRMGPTLGRRSRCDELLALTSKRSNCLDRTLIMLFCLSYTFMRILLTHITPFSGRMPLIFKCFPVFLIFLVLQHMYNIAIKSVS